MTIAEWMSFCILIRCKNFLILDEFITFPQQVTFVYIEYIGHNWKMGCIYAYAYAYAHICTYKYDDKASICVFLVMKCNSHPVPAGLWWALVSLFAICNFLLCQSYIIFGQINAEKEKNSNSSKMFSMKARRSDVMGGCSHFSYDRDHRQECAQEFCLSGEQVCTLLKLTKIHLRARMAQWQRLQVTLFKGWQ